MAKDRDYKRTEALARKGLTQEQIAHCLGIATSTLYEWKKSDPEFSEALKRGQAKGIREVTNALFNSAKNGNVTAQIFYLKNRDPDEWRDRRDHEVSGELNIPLSGKVTFVDKPSDE